MLDWMANSIIAIVSCVPAQLVPRDSPYFALIRTMFALLFIDLTSALLRCSHCGRCGAICEAADRPMTAPAY